MNIPSIIATLGTSFTNKELSLIEELLKLNVNYFRVNLSKCENITALKERIDFLCKIKRKYGEKIRIMLDVPFPGRKPRIYFAVPQFQYKCGDVIIISSKREYLYSKDKSHIYVNVPEIGQKIKNVSHMIYSDGECVLEVVKIIDNDTIQVAISNDVIIYTKKSLSFNCIIKTTDLNDEYIQLVKSLDAESIAFSFVTDKSEITKLSHFFPEVELISKIETQEGIDNIGKIAQCSEIMIGRGDLCLNSNIYNLYNNQKKVASACKNSNTKLYIATGILSSLIYNARPTPADIIDLTNILLLEPDYLILNYTLIKKNPSIALKTILNTVQQLI